MLWQHFKTSGPQFSCLQNGANTYTGVLRGSNVTVFEKHKVDTSLYGKRARKRAKNETNTTKAIVKQLSTQPQNVYLFL